MRAAVIILVSLSGLGLAVWWQLQGVGEHPVAFARRRRQAGLGLLLLMLILGAGSYISVNGMPKRLFAAEEDGSWGAVLIDGRPVSAEDYRIVVEDRQVVGGRDGCNDWGFTDDPPGPDGSRMIISTLVACPEDPVREAYWAVRARGVVPELRPDGSLRLAGWGHVAIFRRCKWERSKAGNRGSGREVCVTHDPDRLVNF